LKERNNGPKRVVNGRPAEFEEGTNVGTLQGRCLGKGMKAVNRKWFGTVVPRSGGNHLKRACWEGKGRPVGGRKGVKENHGRKSHL